MALLRKTHRKISGASQKTLHLLAKSLIMRHDCMRDWHQTGVFPPLIT
jgi:hypothetical protein